MENALIDFNHFRGNQIADTIQQNLDESRMLEIINKLNPKLEKIFDVFTYSYGDFEHNDGTKSSAIYGAGSTPYLAMQEFCKMFYNGIPTK